MPWEQQVYLLLGMNGIKAFWRNAVEVFMSFGLIWSQCVCFIEYLDTKKPGEDPPAS